MKATKFSALIVTIIILSVIAGALLEYFAMSPHSSPTTITMTSPIIIEKTSTVYKTESETSTLVVVQIVSSASTVTSTEYNGAIPSYVEISGTADSQDYFPVSVYFEHCLPAAFVQCNTYPGEITRFDNSTAIVGDVTYSFYAGNYSVRVPNNETYGVSVRLGTYQNGTYLTALAVLPLYAMTPILSNYNIDCFFPNSNHTLSNIACASV